MPAPAARGQVARATWIPALARGRCVNADISSSGPNAGTGKEARRVVPPNARRAARCNMAHRRNQRGLSRAPQLDAPAARARRRRPRARPPTRRISQLTSALAPSPPYTSLRGAGDGHVVDARDETSGAGAPSCSAKLLWNLIGNECCLIPRTRAAPAQSRVARKIYAFRRGRRGGAARNRRAMPERRDTDTHEQFARSQTPRKPRAEPEGGDSHAELFRRVANERSDPRARAKACRRGARTQEGATLTVVSRIVASRIVSRGAVSRVSLSCVSWSSKPLSPVSSPVARSRVSLSRVSWSHVPWSRVSWTRVSWSPVSCPYHGLTYRGLAYRGLAYRGLPLSWSPLLWSRVSWSRVSWSPVSWSPVSWSPV